VTNSRKILIVDDEELLREVLVEVFSSMGHQTFEAASGPEAFSFLQKESVDLVLSDVRMPQGNGIELFEKLRAVKYPGRFVLMSGYSDLALEDAYSMGIDAYFFKPFNLTDIRNMAKILFSPLRERFQRKEERFRCDEKIQISVKDFKAGVSARVLNVGRGGLFLCQKGDLPALHTKLHFEFTLSTSSKPIEGVGIVRWVREDEDQGQPRGYGISFEELSDEAQTQLDLYLEGIDERALIPRGLKT